MGEIFAIVQSDIFILKWRTQPQRTKNDSRWAHRAHVIAQVPTPRHPDSQHRLPSS